MKHVLVSSNEALKRRWLNAFSEGRCCFDVKAGSPSAQKG